MSSIDDLPKVPSRDPLSFCRLCFSQDVYIRIESPVAMLPWFKRIRAVTGLRLTAAEDAPLAICDDCSRELARAEPFVDQCRRCDEALRNDRAGEEVVGDVGLQLVKTEGTEYLVKSEDGPSANPEDIPEPLETELSVSSEFVAEPLDHDSLEVQNYETCYTCQIKFSNRVSLVRHTTQDHLKRSKAYQCCRCLLYIRNSLKFQTHVWKHVRSLEPDPDECGNCQGKSASKSKTPRKAKRGLTCLCGKSFESKLALTTHKRQHLTRCYQCGTCKKRFPSTETYSIHQQTAHQSKSMTAGGTVVYDCAPCKKGFALRATYRSHIRSKHIKILRGKKTIDFEAQLSNQCEGCHKTFKSQAYLDRHINEAHESIHFDCPTCAAQFKQIASYVQHQKQTHGTTGFRCAPCNIFFIGKLTLHRHIAMTHSSMQQDLQGDGDDSSSDGDQETKEEMLEPEDIKLEYQPDDEIKVKVENDEVPPEEIYSPEVLDQIEVKSEFP